VSCSSRQAEAAVGFRTRGPRTFPPLLFTTQPLSGPIYGEYDALKFDASVCPVAVLLGKSMRVGSVVAGHVLKVTSPTLLIFTTGGKKLSASQPSTGPISATRRTKTGRVIKSHIMLPVCLSLWRHRNQQRRRVGHLYRCHSAKQLLAQLNLPDALIATPSTMPLNPPQTEPWLLHPYHRLTSTTTRFTSSKPSLRPSRGSRRGVSLSGPSWSSEKQVEPGES